MAARHRCDLRCGADAHGRRGLQGARLSPRATSSVRPGADRRVAQRGVAAGDRSARGGRRISPDPAEAARLQYPSRGVVDGHEREELRDGWEAADSEPGACADPSLLGQLDWRPALVPGNAADVLERSGVGRRELAAAPMDSRDWWFRRRLVVRPPAAGEQLVLVFEGLATVTEVYLGGVCILRSDSMFESSAVVVTALLAAESELVICCRALAPLLAVTRRPRARWRTRVVADGGLRFFRTMLIGRAPGFAPGPAVVGPWRPIRLERRRRLAITQLQLRSRVVGADGVLEV